MVRSARAWNAEPILLRAVSSYRCNASTTPSGSRTTRISFSGSKQSSIPASRHTTSRHPRPQPRRPASEARTLNLPIDDRLIFITIPAESYFCERRSMAPQKSFCWARGLNDKALPGNVRWDRPCANGGNTGNCSAGMVMNINRSSMASSGFSPPTRVFEVAGAGCLLVVVTTGPG